MTHAVKSSKIIILNIGNILLAGEGVGIPVIQELEKQYAFSEDVSAKKILSTSSISWKRILAAAMGWTACRKL